MSFTDEFNNITKAQNERFRQQDLDDLNHELAGVDVGRIKRFLSPKAREIIQSDRKDKKGLDPLELALLSLEYTQAFEAAERDIREAQQKAGKFLDKADQAIEKLQQEIDDTLAQAVTLPNGKKAFMNKQGEVFTVDGERVDQAIVDGIDWTGKPSLELREDQLRRMDKLQDIANEGSSLSLRLGELDNDLHDDDSHPDKDAVDAIQDETKGITERLDEMDREIEAVIHPPKPQDTLDTAPVELSALPRF